MKKLMKNAFIWETYEKLEKAFEDTSAIFPVKINYYILVNKQELFNKYTIIEKMRQDIGRKYGTYDGKLMVYNIPEDKREIAQSELTQLLEIDQSVEINTCTLKDLEGLEISMQQMEAILFMIEKEE